MAKTSNKPVPAPEPSKPEDGAEPSKAEAPKPEGTGKKLPDVSLSWSGSVLSIAYGDGDSDAIDITSMSAKLRSRAERAGWEDKVRDKSALAKGATIAEKKLATRKTLARFQEDEWDLPRGGGPGFAASDLHEAFKVAHPGAFKTLEDFVSWIEAQASEQGVTAKAIATDLEAWESIAPALEKIRAAKPKPKVDSGKLLQGLMARKVPTEGEGQGTQS